MEGVCEILAVDIPILIGFIVVKYLYYKSEITKATCATSVRIAELELNIKNTELAIQAYKNKARGA